MFLLKTAGRVLRQMSAVMNVTRRGVSHRAYHGETEEDINCRYECLFSRQDMDGWDVRQAMNDLIGYDLVPDPRVIVAALSACRRINDYALTVRFLEAIKSKCGNDVKTIYPYIVQEIAPHVCELGCDFPEGLGYHKPELYLESVYDV